jgi:hypothetical protein
VVTVDKALDEIMKMDFESREMLSGILHRRTVEEKRAMYALYAKKAKNSFSRKELKAQTSEKVMERLKSL